MSRESRSPRGDRLLGAFAAALMLLAVFLATSVRGDAPLTTADVVVFLRAGISERTILTELADRGFREPIDADREEALRNAGASETLVVAVRRAAPAPTPAVTTPVSRENGATRTSAPAIQHTSGRGPTFTTATRTVRVPVSVVDKQGAPVIGLHFGDFRISDGGKPQAVTLFSGERRALRIALALDVSGSMDDKIRQVEAALRHFIAVLEPADEIMVITFNDHVRVVQDFTSDRAQLDRVLDMLEPQGSTALFDAAYEAIQRVAEGPAESKAVVLVTDGVDTESATTFGVLRELARRKEVPVYSIGLDGGSAQRDLFRAPTLPRRPGIGGRGWPGGGGGRGRPGGGVPGGFPGGGGGGGWPVGGGSRSVRTNAASFDARALLDLADETGGRAEIVKGFGHYVPGRDAPQNDHLKAAVESIAMTLRHRYLLGYEPPDGKAGWRTIRVEVDRPATTARSRKGYYAGG
jgi:VWFA-related protein